MKCSLRKRSRISRADKVEQDGRANRVASLTTNGAQVFPGCSQGGEGLMPSPLLVV